MMAKYDKKVAVMSIGRIGEMRMNIANISVKDPGGKLRSHGRGGLGAVMGSKKIKCITVDAADYKEVTIVDSEKFKEASKIFTKALQENPISGQGLPAFGTNVLVNILNEAGGLPTRNFRAGSWEHAEEICGETMAENIKARGGKTTHGCHAGCVIQCSQVYNDKEGKYLTSGFEYETIWALGAHLGIRDLDLIAKSMVLWMTWVSILLKHLWHLDLPLMQAFSHTVTVKKPMNCSLMTYQRALHSEEF